MKLLALHSKILKEKQMLEQRKRENEEKIKQMLS